MQNQNKSRLRKSGEFSHPWCVCALGAVPFHDLPHCSYKQYTSNVSASTTPTWHSGDAPFHDLSQYWHVGRRINTPPTFRRTLHQHTSDASADTDTLTTSLTTHHGYTNNLSPLHYGYINNLSGNTLSTNRHVARYRNAENIVSPYLVNTWLHLMTFTYLYFSL